MIVRHPTLEGVTRDVPDPDEWKAQGWVPEPPPRPQSPRHKSDD